jgi:hypothetical protein
MFLRNVGLPPSYTVLQPRRPYPDYRCDNLKTKLLFAISKRPMGSVVYSVVGRCKNQALFVCLIQSTVASLH